MAAQTHRTPAKLHAHALRLGAALALLLAVILPVPRAQAATLDVCPTGAGYATIQAAIDAAAPGAVIHVCAATFLENITITKDLTLLGAGRDATTVDGGARGSVVTVPPGVTAAISHLTLTNGRVELSDAIGWGSGGGIHNEGSLILDDINVNRSVAYMGGGIANERGDLTIRNSIVIDNQAEMGAGILNNGTWEGTATMLVSKTYIVDNFATVDLFEWTHDDAGAGGGLYNSDHGLLRVELSDIDSNVAERYGGGIQNSEGQSFDARLWVTDTIVRGNNAFGGGGISNNATADIAGTSISGNQAQSAVPDAGAGFGGGISSSVTLRVVNSTISGNYASQDGGGIYTNNSADAQNSGPAVVALTNVTLADNSADGRGGNLYAEWVSPQLKNSILAHSLQGGSCAGIAPTSLGYNVVDDGSCALGGPGDLPAADPRLGEWDDHGGPTPTYPLLRGSPAVDLVGAGACTVAADQRGVPRPQGPRCDSGAFELAQAAPGGLLLGYPKSGKVGGVSFANEDILFLDLAAGRWSKFFDGSDVGLAHSDVDAFAPLADGTLLLTFSQDTQVPGLGKVVKDQDIVRFVPRRLGPTTAGSFTWYLHGSDLGFGQRGQGLDALTFTPGGALVISPRNRLVLPGAKGEDEDLLAWNPGTRTWSFYLDGSQLGLGDRPQEAIKAASIDAAGALYFATAGAFAAGGVQGNGSQVWVCTPRTAGSLQPCDLSLFWDGAALGPGGLNIDGLTLVTAPPALVAASFTEEDDTGDVDMDEGDQNVHLFLPAVSQ